MEQEEKSLFKKEYGCPVCENKFSQPVIKTGYLKLIRQDKDLRMVHVVDTNKYDVIQCPFCGYAALTKFFGPLATPHKKMIQQKQVDYDNIPYVDLVISYDEALIRYEAALQCALARQAKASELALLHLRTAWIYRGMKEAFLNNNQENVSNVDDFDQMMKEQMQIERFEGEEKDHLHMAKEGFLKARKEEQSPIAGMNDTTLDYLLAVLCMWEQKYQDSYKLLQGILLSKTTTKEQKQKASDLVLELKQILSKD